MCGARWIPDRHLAVKLLESPENEDGYTSVHFTFPIPAGSRALFLSSCPSFCVLLLLLFLLHLLLFVPPSPFSHRRLYPVRKEEARSKMRYSSVQQAMLSLLLSAGWLAGWLMVPMLLMAPSHAVKNRKPEPEEERGERGRKRKKEKK